MWPTAWLLLVLIIRIGLPSPRIPALGIPVKSCWMACTRWPPSCPTPAWPEAIVLYVCRVKPFSSCPAKAPNTWVWALTFTGTTAPSPTPSTRYDEALDAHLDVSLREVMFAAAGYCCWRVGPPNRLRHNRSLFAMGAAMHALFVEAGITPDYLLGHSIGELTAAYLAGVLSLPDAAVLVTARSRLMQACPPGAMVSIVLPANATS